MINWEDHTKRNALLSAIEAAYPKSDDLEMFVDLKVGKNPETVASGSNIAKAIYNLIKSSKAGGWIDELYKSFLAENKTNANPQVVAAIREIEDQNLISKSDNTIEIPFGSLFECFSSDDISYLKAACLRSLECVLLVEWTVAESMLGNVTALKQIQSCLERYSTVDKGPTLAVSFSEFAIEIIKEAEQNLPHPRDLTIVEAWRDRIAEQFDVSPCIVKKSQSSTCDLHLLVSLKERGKKLQPYPELYVVQDGQSEAIKSPSSLQVPQQACSFDEFMACLYRWIKSAEEFLKTTEKYKFSNRQVILELLLPDPYLVDDVAEWQFNNEDRGKPSYLRFYRPFLIRSLSRIQDSSVKADLEAKWINLLGVADVQLDNSFCFIEEINQALEDDDYVASMFFDQDSMIGLQVLAQLNSVDADKLAELLIKIRYAPILITLWCTDFTGCSEQEYLSALKKVFDNFLKDTTITDFAGLARRWRNFRRDFSTRHVRLLCECPDRWPKKLPDYSNEAQKFIAS